MSAPRSVRAAVLAILLATVACGGDPVLVPSDQGAFLYLVLGQSTPFQGRPDEPAGQYAVLLSLGAPTEDIVLRSGERFDLRREADGHGFGWQDLGRDGERGRAGSDGATLLRHVTHYLPPAPAAGLGSDSLIPLADYALTVEVDGVIITGAVRLPGSIEARRSEDGRSVVWNEVVGAAGYRVLTGALESHYTTSTWYPLAAEDLSHRRVQVQALEPNAWRYFTDPEAVRSGIDRGRGVFGGMTESVLEW